MARKSTEVLAWHFVGNTLRDGRPIPEDRTVLTQSGRIVPCRNGLHASIRVIDALRYAPGETLCRVVCSGTVQHDADKIASSRRTILWRIDATPVLREFARRCALDVAHLWDMPPIVRAFLETGDETLRAAAGDAARAAAGDAARAAAWAAAGDAAWNAARAAARDAAWAAAGDAAWNAAWNAAVDLQNTRLEQMALDAHADLL